jgi:hypothetical protein
MSDIEGDLAFEPDNLPQEGRPEWLPEEFKTGEDLAKAYTEAQRKITEQGQQLSELTQAFNDLSFSPEPQQYVDQQQEQAYEYQQRDALAQMQYLAQQAPGAIPARSPLDPALQATIAEIVTKRNMENLTVQAEQLVSEHVQDWPVVKPQVTSLFSSSPEWQRALQEAAQTGSPALSANIR